MARTERNLVCLTCALGVSPIRGGTLNVAVFRESRRVFRIRASRQCPAHHLQERAAHHDGDRDAGTRWQEAKRLFEAAIAMEESQREAWLRDVCGSEAELHAEVQSLLAWHRESTGFLETPVARVAELPVTSTFDQPLVGQSLGAWRIVDIIGRGGMGVVYRAERADDAFQRQAAIKVVRFGRHSAHIVERFRRERETLAALDHPNIARLMDGGTTPDGQPYFVMELVDGIPVDQYCDEHALTIDQRLDLFRAICAGVQYAHENLVVHRDIKPDNILVTREGVPKLLDFGIATIVSRDATTAVGATERRGNASRICRIVAQNRHRRFRPRAG